MLLLDLGDLGDLDLFLDPFLLGDLEFFLLGDLEFFLLGDLDLGMGIGVESLLLC